MRRTDSPYRRRQPGRWLPRWQTAGCSACNCCPGRSRYRRSPRSVPGSSSDTENRWRCRMHWLCWRRCGCTSPHSEVSGQGPCSPQYPACMPDAPDRPGPPDWKQQTLSLRHGHRRPLCIPCSPACWKCRKQRLRILLEPSFPVLQGRRWKGWFSDRRISGCRLRRNRQ